MRVLIINLTRFGDVLQTQPVVHALADGGHEVGFACLDNFAEAAALLDGVQALFPLPGGRLLATLDADWRRSAAVLSDFGMAVRRFAADRVLNLTSTLSARLLARLLAGSGPVGGFSVDEQGFGDNGTLWGAFLEAATRKRGCSPYNLADTFRKTAGVGDVPFRFALRRPSPRVLDAVKQLLAGEAGGTPPGGYMAFQLGASDARRRWPTAHFAAIGRLVRERCGVMPVLVGAPDERELGAAYQAAGSPAVNLIGRTSLEELSAVLVLSRLLITNDTGTMHLAAGLGVPVLALFLATAQPWDTGPYREGSCSLEPRMDCHPCPFNAPSPHAHACRQAVSPETAAGLVLSRLRGGTWEAGPDARREARVWLSLRDGEGFMNLRSLSGDDESERGLWFRVQRGFYRHFLDAWTRDAAQDARREKFSAPAPESLSVFPPGSPCRERIFSTAEKASAMLLLALEQGRLLRLRPTERSRTAFLATCSRLAGIFSDSPDFVPLSLLWRTALQEHGGDLPAVFRFFELLRGELSSLTRRD